MIRQILLIAAAALFPLMLKAQTGCTDVQAQNYNAAAIVNDGSCTYPPTTYFAPIKAYLADTLREISGMTLANGQWWTLADSGNDDTFFQFDPEDGSVKKYIKLKQAKNEDWEDIATDGLNLYIGDFGNNNSGNRTDLSLYKVPLSAIGNSTVQSVNNNEYEFIPFRYQDQVDFDNQPEDSIEFDCEAMIYHNGKIHLFSKNWKNRTSAHYVLNQQTGIAEKLETFDVQGLITSAAISPDGKLIVLLGYNKIGTPNVFLWLLWDWQGTQFFSGNKRRIDLGSPITYGKSEAIAFKSERTGYIGNEFLELGGIVFAPQATRTFDFSQFVPTMVNAEDTPDTALNTWRTSPNPFSQQIDFQYFGNQKPESIRIRNLMGIEIFRSSDAVQQIDTSTWPSGTYFFEAIFGGKSVSFAAVKA